MHVGTLRCSASVIWNIFTSAHYWSLADSTIKYMYNMQNEWILHQQNSMKFHNSYPFRCYYIIIPYHIGLWLKMLTLDAQFGQTRDVGVKVFCVNSNKLIAWVFFIILLHTNQNFKTSNLDPIVYLFLLSKRKHT